MSNHIGFEAIKCKELYYVREGKCWVCMDLLMELKYPDTCMRCKFAEKKRQEERMRKEKKYGSIL